MRVAVVGGTLLVGRYTVEALEREGHEVVVVARSWGVDVTTGAGLNEALAGDESLWPVPQPLPQPRGRSRRFPALYDFTPCPDSA
jgi:NAD(P)-dependent dehydrogenase (short-subunit alcohol dehydrogenase family)